MTSSKSFFDNYESYLTFGDIDLFGRALLGLFGVAARLEGVGGVVAELLEQLRGNGQQVAAHQLLDLAAVAEGGAHDLKTSKFSKK